MLIATLLSVLVLANPTTTQADAAMPIAAKVTVVMGNLVVINEATNVVTSNHLLCALRVLSHAAGYKNRYYLIRDLEQKSKAIPLKTRQEKAIAVANKVADDLANRTEIKFNMEGIHYWIDTDDVRSMLPVKWWKYRHKATVKLVQTLTRMNTEIIIGGRPMYTLFLGEDWAFTEYKWPEKEYANYLYDYGFFVLNEGVEPEVRCMTGTYRKIWIGGDSAAWLVDREERGLSQGFSMSSTYKRLMGEGLWIGQAKIRGEMCDVVLNQLDLDDPSVEHVFFVNKRGALLRRDIILGTGTPQIFVMAMDYEHLDSPVTASELLPPTLTDEWKEREVIVREDGTLTAK